MLFDEFHQGLSSLAIGEEGRMRTFPLPNLRRRSGIYNTYVDIADAHGNETSVTTNALDERLM